MQSVKTFYSWAASSAGGCTFTLSQVAPLSQLGQEGEIGGAPQHQGCSLAGAALPAQPHGCPGPSLPSSSSLPVLREQLGTSIPAALAPLHYHFKVCTCGSGGTRTLPPSVLPSLHPPPRGEGEPRCWQARAGFISFT